MFVFDQLHLSFVFDEPMCTCRPGSREPLILKGLDMVQAFLSISFQEGVRTTLPFAEIPRALFNAE